ncbi:hypothetical protein [Saccharothrix algeriensis]|uniref:Uncharacterized protein n=1 Tax=Saccharothrix algeriensis TaxID=173560 RepID=A0ABS2SJD1_9PSEU|nr:hypothetical protein [Saccharothrix algeriensis]MBM7815156.1 hypothetical protein [Saccharothrix algeriensis]
MEPLLCPEPGHSGPYRVPRGIGLVPAEALGEGAHPEPVGQHRVEQRLEDP